MGLHTSAHAPWLKIVFETMTIVMTRTAKLMITTRTSASGDGECDN